MNEKSSIKVKLPIAATRTDDGSLYLSLEEADRLVLDLQIAVVKHRQTPEYKQEEERKRQLWMDRPAPGCRSDDDGYCDWKKCPQVLDGEPKKSGRHCPRDIRYEEY